MIYELDMYLSIVGLSLPEDGANISLLQYADDALFFGEWSKSNMIQLLHILNCFHDVSGVKINLLKSRLFGIDVSEEEVVNIARVGYCFNDSLPFSYLGLPIGRNLNRIDAWSDVVQKFTKRLSSWKSNLLSIGGSNLMVKKIYNGNKTSFWYDNWISECGLLRCRFPRLFALETYKSCLVSDRWVFVDGIWIGPEIGNLLADLMRRYLSTTIDKKILACHANTVEKIIWLKISSWWKAPPTFHPSFDGILTGGGLARHDDIFLAVERQSLFWIFNRVPSRLSSWNSWIQHPDAADEVS
nr:reverse transcriptase domain, reverse transcriptase zinc-binding domain protein [Tanacetum cinerariifolium]GEY24961.1 reverse transcriptase domain, reverse transcriptase zinc-binding domain protein [Tanacetum cinerariifolium]